MPRVAERTFRVLATAGLARIAQARHVPTEELVALLDEGGYARYDFRTAERLQALSEVIGERYDEQTAEIGRQYQSYPELRAALDSLPGWGPTTVQLFLRELRGVGGRPATSRWPRGFRHGSPRPRKPAVSRPGPEDAPGDGHRVRAGSA
jgi:endonuclease III